MTTGRGCSKPPTGAAAAALAAALVLAGSLAGAPPSGAQTRHDTFIPAAGAADSLDATYFIPTSAPPPAGHPGILFVHGYGGSKHDDTANGRIYAASGYVTLCYSVRGHGESTGGSTIMSAAERADLAAVVEFMRAIPGIDTGAIGISGGSQGGLHGLWALADRLPVKAASSDVIVPGWATDMLMNGSVRRTLMLLLNSSRVTYGPVRDTLWEHVRNDRYDELLAAFAAGRDVDTAALNSGSVPSLRFLKWQDHYFSAAGGIEAFRNYGGPKKLYLGTRGHFSDQAESERLYQYDQVSRWLAHHLRGEENGIMDEPAYTFAASSLPMDTAGYFTWTRSGSGGWPPPGITPYRFYLAADSSLSFAAPTAPADSFFIANVHLDSSYTFDIGYIEGFRGPSFEAALPRQSIGFESGPLPRDVEWIGSPRMEIFVSSPSLKFPLHAQIYEVDTAGTKYFVNRIDYTARGWPGGEGVIAAEGIAHAHRFGAGSRIRLELTNIDVTNRRELGEYPFVLPLFSNAEVAVFADVARRSYIELPLAQSPLGADAAGIPHGRGPELLDAYPNPFNAAATLTADIPSGGRATLALYNILGQRVAVLFDGDLDPGRRAFRWEASAHPAGVYFARLSVAPRDAANGPGGRVHAVKKLVLAK